VEVIRQTNYVVFADDFFVRWDYNEPEVGALGPSFSEENPFYYIHEEMNYVLGFRLLLFSYFDEYINVLDVTTMEQLSSNRLPNSLKTYRKLRSLSFFVEKSFAAARVSKNIFIMNFATGTEKSTMATTLGNYNVVGLAA
jgi:hypothetical protein